MVQAVLLVCGSPVSHEYIVCCLVSSQVVSTCDRMVTTGNSYTEACRSFSVSIKELSSHFKDSEVVTVSGDRGRGRGGGGGRERKG